MKPGFMTSVCPQQTVAELIATARQYGYQGIEFRVEWDHQHGVELGATPEQLATTRRLLADNGIAASCIATSVKFNSPDRAAHLPQRETLRKYIALAAEIGAPYIRTFSDSLPEEDAPARDHVMALAAESYAAVDEWARQHGIGVLVETHTNMRAHWARQILDMAQAESLQVLWHIGHHVSRGQSVDEAYPHIRGHVRHLHFSAMPGKDVTDADNRRTFELLAQDNFQGFFSVEVINPQDPNGVLAHHIAKFNEFMQATR
ncbi:MAG: sugar phosphate isomerase/epimerase [Chloroflexi bacterium]|jgi:sugar phosphate isomerase/epimerase|nr:sugar phosphate isomerase/epimerase [Chloroflexota bacterium]